MATYESSGETSPSGTASKRAAHSLSLAPNTGCCLVGKCLGLRFDAVELGDAGALAGLMQLRWTGRTTSPSVSWPPAEAGPLSHFPFSP